MAAETLLQTFFTRLGFQTDTKGLDEYKDKIVSLSESLLKLSGVATLSLGGLFELTRRATEPLAAVAKMSDTYGIATETIAAFNRMGRQFGITTESMMGGLQNLNTAIAAVGIGQGRFLTKIAEQYGLKVRDANGHLKDMRTFLGDVAERMTTMSGMEQNLLVKRLGLAPEMVRMLRNGRDAFNELYESMARGLPFTDEDYRKAERFQIEFQNARAALGVISSQIALELMPLFQKAMESFLKWWRGNGERVMARIKYWVGMFVDWGKNIISFIERVGGEAATLNVILGTLGTALGIVVATKLAGWAFAAAKAITALAGANALATWQIWLIVAAIAVLVGLVLLAIDDFEAWKANGVSVIGTLVDKFAQAEGAMKKLRDVGKWVWEQFKSYWEWMKESWGAAFDQMKKTFAAWWPEIKSGLILIGGLLAGAIVVVAALALGFVILIGKVLEWTGAFLEWLALLKDKPEEAIAKLSAFLQSILDKVQGWFKSAWAAFDAWMDAQLQALWNRFKTWMEGLWNDFASWVWGGVDKAVAAFVGVFVSIGDAIQAAFRDKVMAMLDSIGAAIQEWFDKWIGKITGGFEKVKGFFGKASEAATPAVAKAAAYTPYEAPPFLAGEHAVPLTGAERRAQLSQENVGNTTQNNTFNVNSMQEATEGADKLQQNLKRQQQQLPNLAGPQLVW